MRTGNTPIAKIRYSIGGILNTRGTVYAKCEWYNPTGSIKDRAAQCILVEAITLGKLVKGQEIVEATSGNMGISLASLGRKLKYPVTIFIPKNASEERIKMLKLLGANLIISEDLNSAIRDAKQYAQEHKAYYTDQFNNPASIIANKITGNEILNDMNKRSDVMLERLKKKSIGFAAGYGSGGTLFGVASVLYYVTKPEITIIEIKLADRHTKIQGLNSEFIPGLYNKRFIDETVTITDNDAIAMAQKLNKAGYPVGISGGANFLGAVLSSCKVCYTIFPDDNKKYLSTELVEEIHTPLVDSIEIY